mgnify:CR=1 FL=1
MRHFLALLDLTSSEIHNLLDKARALKADLARGHRPSLLPNRVLGLIFGRTAAAEAGRKHGAIGVITKPFNPMTLARTIATLWNQHREALDAPNPAT